MAANDVISGATETHVPIKCYAWDTKTPFKHKHCVVCFHLNSSPDEILIKQYTNVEYFREFNNKVLTTITDKNFTHFCVIHPKKNQEVDFIIQDIKGSKNFKH